MIALAAYLFGIGIPETYQREIPRRRAKRRGLSFRESPAQSGVTIPEMFQITVITPLKMLVTEPVVMLISFELCFSWGVLFSWFITVPVVLQSVYGFSLQQAGLAFIAAVVGSILAAAMTILIEQFIYRKAHYGMIAIEYRLIPAMIGGCFILASLFWIGWTATPTIHWASPVVGTMLYVWGNLSILVSYLLVSATYLSRPTIA
jgi:hypothetical protein